MNLKTLARNLAARARLRRKPRPGTRTRVTGAGFGSVLLIVMITAAAFNTGTNLLYLILAGLLSFWMLTILMHRANLGGLSARRILTGDIHAGLPGPVLYEITSRRARVTSFGVSIHEETGPAQPAALSAFFPAIAPGSTVTAYGMAVFPRRGVVEFDMLRLGSLFPFGFLSHERRMPEPGRVVVFPAPAEVTAFLNGRSPDLGQRETTQKGNSGGLYSIRDYVAGDPARSIHWKLSSKGTGVKVREQEREDSRRVRLILDPGLPEEPSPGDLERFERLLSLAAGLARHFIGLEYEVGLWSPAGTAPPGSGHAHLRDLYRMLALADARAFCHSTGPARRPPAAEGFNDVRVEETAARD